MKQRIHLLMALVFRSVAALSLALFIQSAAAQLPVFQYAIFYNLNLEMAAGQPQTIEVPVFCNASIWEGSQNLNFNTNVYAVGTNYTIGVDPFNPSYSTGSSEDQGSTAPYSGTPEANFAAGPPNDNATALVMPIGNATNSDPTNVETILNLPPPALSVPNAAGYYSTNQIYLYNESDLIISNAAYGTNSLAPGGTNITIYFDDKYRTPQLTQLTNDFYTLKTPAATGLYTNYVTSNLADTNRCYTNVYYAGWSFATNVAFYDYREKKSVQAVQVDVSQFNIWVTNNVAVNGGGHFNSQCLSDKGHPIDSIWVYNSVPLTGAQLPAVRLVNGQQLPSSYGLTVSTPMPAYILGNYNVQQANGGFNDIGTNDTAYTYPAAVLADAITVISSNWNDTLYTNGYPLASRNPSPTTVNAAMLEGIVQTVPTISGNYSGGVENFLRLLEYWGNPSPALTYNGSIVVMFPSIYATNYWGSANVYSVPKRQWAFDLNFAKSDGSGLPPLTPSVGCQFPVIFTQPQSQTIASGSNVTFSVTASSIFPLNFQWQLNGTNISGGTVGAGAGSTTSTNGQFVGLFGLDEQFNLTLNNVQSSQAGNYSVQITNSFGLTNSSAAVLTVTNMPPMILTQPTNQSLIVGQTATFSVTAGGTQPLSYQWQFDSANLTNATNATLTLNNATTNQAGGYSVTVTNVAGSVTSSNAVLSVYASAAATFNAFSLSDTNGFQFMITGVPGFNYAVQASTNLIDWVSLVTNASPFSFADTNTPGFQQRFYRSIYLP